MNQHTEYRFFFVWNLNKEKLYLEDKSRKGQHLSKVGFFKYTFRHDEAREYSYDFDYQILNAANEQTYLSNRNGWELIDKYGPWYYFRKPKSQTKDLLHNNINSAIKMYQRVLSLLLLIGIPNYLFLYIFFPEFFGNGELSSFFIVFRIFIICFLFMHITTLIKLICTIWNLKKYDRAK